MAKDKAAEKLPPDTYPADDERVGCQPDSSGQREGRTPPGAVGNSQLPGKPAEGAKPPKTLLQSELALMNRISKLLATASPESAARVTSYLYDHFGPVYVPTGDFKG